MGLVLDQALIHAHKQCMLELSGAGICLCVSFSVRGGGVHNLPTSHRLISIDKTVRAATLR